MTCWLLLVAVGCRPTQKCNIIWAYKSPPSFSRYFDYEQWLGRCRKLRSTSFVHFASIRANQPSSPIKESKTCFVISADPSHSSSLSLSLSLLLSAPSSSPLPRESSLGRISDAISVIRGAPDITKERPSAQIRVNISLDDTVISSEYDPSHATSPRQV